mmetsp:Transcript_14569/g.35423  ORF Transcript_14569/g.35423 Transcript_14569/m.35423 type:complete len:216 (-) Transcript_14569:112-759(-)
MVWCGPFFYQLLLLLLLLLLMVVVVMCDMSHQHPRYRTRSRWSTRFVPYGFHRLDQFPFSTTELLMEPKSLLWSDGDPLESIQRQLALEGLVPCLVEVVRDDVTDERIPFMDHEPISHRVPRHDVCETFIFSILQHLVDLDGERLACLLVLVSVFLAGSSISCSGGSTVLAVTLTIISRGNHGISAVAVNFRANTLLAVTVRRLLLAAVDVAIVR